VLQNVIASALDIASTSVHSGSISSRSVCDVLLQFFLKQVEASEECVTDFRFNVCVCQSSVNYVIINGSNNNYNAKNGVYVVYSWHSRFDSSPGLFGECGTSCTIASDPQNKSANLGCVSA